MTPTKKTQEKFDVRMNSRFTATQSKNIKSEAKKLGLTEGEMHRSIVDFYFNAKKEK